MTKRKISPKSLKNLYQSNQEANQIARESIGNGPPAPDGKKDLPQISISELVKKAGVSRNAFLPQLQVQGRNPGIGLRTGLSPMDGQVEGLADKVQKNWGPSNFQRLSPTTRKKKCPTIQPWPI